MAGDVASLSAFSSFSGSRWLVCLRWSHFCQHFIKKRYLLSRLLSATFAVFIGMLIKTGLANNFLSLALSHPSHYVVQQQATPWTIIVNNFTQTNLVSRHIDHLKEGLVQEKNKSKSIIYGGSIFQRKKQRKIQSPLRRGLIDTSRKLRVFSS